MAYPRCNFLIKGTRYCNKNGGGHKMSTFKCSDMKWDCPFEVSGETRNDVASHIIRHIHSEHGIEVIPNETMMKARNAINP
jgi:predicted small metal-binding protein